MTVVLVVILSIPLAVVLLGVLLFLRDLGLGFLLGLWLGWRVQAPRPQLARRLQVPDPQLRLWPE